MWEWHIGVSRGPRLTAESHVVKDTAASWAPQPPGTEGRTARGRRGRAMALPHPPLQAGSPRDKRVGSTFRSARITTVAMDYLPEEGPVGRSENHDLRVRVIARE